MYTLSLSLYVSLSLYICSSRFIPGIRKWLQLSWSPPLSSPFPTLQLVDGALLHPCDATLLSASAHLAKAFKGGTMILVEAETWRKPRKLEKLESQFYRSYTET